MPTSTGGAPASRIKLWFVRELERNGEAQRGSQIEVKALCEPQMCVCVCGLCVVFVVWCVCGLCVCVWFMCVCLTV